MTATARPVSDDPFQNHRFHVIDTSGFLNFSAPVAGFNMVTLPELNIDIGEYREGLWTYSRKQPLRPHFTQASLHKGVMKTDSSFYRWALCAVEGRTYRTDIVVKQFHRTDVSGLINYKTATASREVRLYNCTPMRLRLGSDHDAMSSDVSIEELDIDPEYIRIFINGQEIKL